MQKKRRRKEKGLFTQKEMENFGKFDYDQKRRVCVSESCRQKTLVRCPIMDI